MYVQYTFKQYIHFILGHSGPVRKSRFQLLKSN